jgi:hypothetical protein
MNLTCCKTSRLALSAAFQKRWEGKRCRETFAIFRSQIGEEENHAKRSNLELRNAGRYVEENFFRRFLSYRSQIIGHKHSAAALNPNK